MKLLKSPHISPFGGLNFVLEEFDRLNVGNLLSQELPALPKQTYYSWRDLFYSFWSVLLCGGSCAEDLAENFKLSLSKNPLLKVPSPDRVLDRMKQLANSSQIYTTPRGEREHEFCHNDLLNMLNIKLLKRMPSFNKKAVTLDYDNTLIFTNKEDANMTYKKQFGYAPGVGIVGNKVVYIENRNGNSAAQNLQEMTLSRMFRLLGDEGVTVDKFRADGASYQLKTLLTIRENTQKFYVRANLSEAVTSVIGTIENWTKIQTDQQEFFRGEIEYTPFKNQAKRDKCTHLLQPYRLVVTKVKRADGQLNFFTQEAYNYHCIITNDYEMTLDQIVMFYNQRGAIERQFDVLKNDFSWKNMPFSKISQNTVFLIFTAICRNLYDHIILTFTTKFKQLTPRDRLKKFIFRFICLPAKWIKKARQWQLRIYGQVAFKT